MRIKAAIIGMGIGQKHYDAIEKYKNSEVKIICEKNQKKINYLKKKFPNKIITKNENKIFSNKDINLVSIASYDNDHYSQIMKSLHSDKHVIVEKPICLKNNQLKNIYKILKKKKKLKFVSNLVLRTNSLFKNFKKNIDIKNVFYIEADYIWGRKHKLFGWRSKIKDYSLILGAAIHMIDLVLWITNLKPISVYTVGSDKITKKTIFKKKSLILMLFEFSNGLIVKITANAVAAYEHFHELKIFSKNQTLINSKLGTAEYKKNKFQKINSKYPDKKNRKKLIQNFLDTIINQKSKPMISLKEQMDTMLVCFAAEKSLKLKRKVRIKYLK